MEKILSELNTDKAKTVAEAALETVKTHAVDMGDVAKEKVIAVTENAKDVKVVADLLTDIEEKPEKVKREAGIAGIAAVLTFAGIRIFDSYRKKPQD